MSRRVIIRGTHMIHMIVPSVRRFVSQQRRQTVWLPAWGLMFVLVGMQFLVKVLLRLRFMLPTHVGPLVWADAYLR